MANPNIIEIKNDKTVIQATNVSLAEGLRPSRIVLRTLPGKYVTHREYLTIRVETRTRTEYFAGLKTEHTYDYVILEHEAFDQGHYFDYAHDMSDHAIVVPPSCPAQVKALADAKNDFAERASRHR